VDAGTTAEELATAVSAVLSPGHIPAARLAVACADALADAAEFFKQGRHTQYSFPLAL